MVLRDGEWLEIRLSQPQFYHQKWFIAIWIYHEYPWVSVNGVSQDVSWMIGFGEKATTWSELFYKYVWLPACWFQSLGCAISTWDNRMNHWYMAQPNAYQRDRAVLCIHDPKPHPVHDRYDLLRQMIGVSTLSFVVNIVHFLYSMLHTCSIFGCIEMFRVYLSKDIVPFFIHAGSCTFCQEKVEEEPAGRVGVQSKEEGGGNERVLKGLIVASLVIKFTVFFWGCFFQPLNLYFLLFVFLLSVSRLAMPFAFLWGFATATMGIGSLPGSHRGNQRELARLPGNLPEAVE